MFRILVADDHFAVRQGLLQLIREYYPDAEIGEAADTTALINISLQENWNLIVTDLVMPGGGAIPAIKQIKHEKPDLPIVVISTHSNEAYEDWTLKSGADFFLSKDLVSTRLAVLIRQILHDPM
ncbi:response regulator [Flavihumibacter petaseus]|uniref:Response regulatory domain-containing protein n=1 Tax=Flavihumibacter petaseus NBRC 106054 TaxID=1220578 RepID=A0A0E9MYF5_9BACT|nr:response regulator transcription factor [Flavihumibacter petaseus]GAO42767.1 hypothetical protein FPE01S_01_17850 [Flavihumibacter petaseus NBRC 106054]